jgi:tetratricopeptide (TPR) repeat protein
MRILIAAALIATPAAGAVTVFGSTDARLCYEAAESDDPPSVSDIGVCTNALAREGLGRYETVATLVNRGILKLRRGDGAQAMADFDAALRNDPAQPEALLNKGLAILRIGGSAEAALPLLDRAIAGHTDKLALAYYGRGLANEALGRVPAAYRDYSKASLLDPKWPAPREELARFSVRPK